ncbi:hypothetical protein ACEPAF_6073 [Sanghuangporus sanghuang]
MAYQPPSRGDKRAPTFDGSEPKELPRRSKYLITNGKILESQADEMFLMGITGDLREALIRRIEIKLPDHDSSTPYKIKDVLEHSNFVLGGKIVGSFGSNFPPPATGEASTSIVKKEEVDLAKVMDTLKSFQVTLDALSKGNVPHRPGAERSETPRNPVCNFCGEAGHYIRSCTKVLEYIQAGKCVRSQDGRIVLPNGGLITRSLPGNNLKERIDSFHAKAPATHTVGMVESVTPAYSHQAGPAYAYSHDEEDQDEQENYDIERLEILINEAKKKAAGGRRTKPDGVEIPRVQPHKKAQAKPQPAPPSGARPSTRSLQSPQQDDITRKSQPQYKYVVPIEDSSAVSNVLTRTLDTPITISQRELLSIAPDVRKQMKELTTAKRYNAAEVKYGEVVDDSLTLQVGRFASEQVETGETLSTEEILALSGQGVAAEASMPLRTVSALIEDTLEVECVLDQGAVVCLLREDVWEKLQIPLSPDKGMILETADAARSSTIGMISNAKFTIAGIDVSLQVQVVPNAPFQALLGRPFFAITECETKDYTSGDQHITLTDPNDRRKQSKVATGIRTIARGPLPKGFPQASRN